MSLKKKSADIINLFDTSVLASSGRHVAKESQNLFSDTLKKMAKKQDKFVLPKKIGKAHKDFPKFTQDVDEALRLLPPQIEPQQLRRLVSNYPLDTVSNLLKAMGSKNSDALALSLSRGRDMIEEVAGGFKKMNEQITSMNKLLADFPGKIPIDSNYVDNAKKMADDFEKNISPKTINEAADPNVANATLDQGQRIAMQFQVMRMNGFDTPEKMLSKLDPTDARVKANFSDLIGFLQTQAKLAGTTLDDPTFLKMSTKKLQDDAIRSAIVMGEAGPIFQKMTKSFTKKTKKAVQDKLNKLKTELEQGVVVAPKATGPKMALFKKLATVGIISAAVLTGLTVTAGILWLIISSEMDKSQDKEDISDKLNEKFMKIITAVYNGEISVYDALLAIEVLIQEAKDFDIPVPKEFLTAAEELKKKVKLGLDLAQDISDGKIDIKDVYKDSRGDNSEGTQVPEEEEEKPFYKRWFWTIFIISLVLILIAIIIGVYFFMSKKKSNVVEEVATSSYNPYDSYF